MICKNCKKELPDKTTVCPDCGFETTVTKGNKKVPKSTIVLIIICAAFVIVASMLALKLKEQGKASDFAQSNFATSVEQESTHKQYSKVFSEQTAAYSNENNPLMKAELSVYSFDSKQNKTYAALNLSKQTVKGISSTDFEEFFQSIVSKSRNEYVTIDFGDSTGLMIFKATDNVMLYGTLNEQKAVTGVLGYALKSENGFSYFPLAGVQQTTALSTTQPPASETQTETTVQTVQTTQAEITEAVQAAVSKETYDSPNQIVYVTPSGKKYHKKGCTYISSSSALSSFSVEEAKEQGYSPCSRCKP